VSVLLGPKLALARAAGALSRLRGGGATSVPGKVLIRLQPDVVGVLGSRLAHGSVLISATNGKTTTAAMAAAILEREGVRLVHNRAGANMAGGIASTLLAAAHGRDAIDGELGLFEVDELWLAQLTAQLRPRALLLGNLFRDQLDRYGELETIADSWAHTVRAVLGGDARLVLNADDPMVADLGRERAGVTADGATTAGGALGDPRVVYFGVDDDSLALPHMAHAADAKHCRNCGAPYLFEAVYLGHLGHYHCPSCGQARPTPAVLATNVRLEGVRAARFTLHTPTDAAEVVLPLPGLYNVYNALAATALAHALEVPLAGIVAGLGSMRAAFGRAESVTIGAPDQPRELRILLVKNPAGANEVLRTLALEPGEHDLLGVLNDNIADGRDVSWIWDADFELLTGRVRRVTCSGTRAAELAVRLKYGGVEPERIHVQPELPAALAAAQADAPPGGGPLYALPTYTAMLALRELLSAGGQTRSALT
jgi:UDP-N-acetylmuramyl tripeptide synthase